MGSEAESEAKLAAPKLFGRRSRGGTPQSTDEPAPVAEAPAGSPAEPATEPDATPGPPEPRTPRKRLPALVGLPAAACVGLVVGAFLVLATYGSLHLCSSVRGASTCGGRAGFPLLLAIGIVAVVGGGALLRVCGVRSPVGDSFLAVALVAVLTVLFLNNHYDAWWMIIAVPMLTLLAFLLSHWVSATYIDPADK